RGSLKKSVTIGLIGRYPPASPGLSDRGSVAEHRQTKPSLNDLRGDDYFSSHPEWVKNTVILVDSGGCELDEESITTLQFSRIKLGSAARYHCSANAVGWVVMVLPLDK